jgi:4-hydroxybenzoyl-CoA reductase subunit alpha
VIGKRTPLIDSKWKVTGQALYGDDIRLPGEIIGRLVRTDRHYARVLSIDASEAEAIPGVLGIATGEDAPHAFGVLPVTKDEHAMAVEKVRHIGDIVACVAAEDEDTARLAANSYPYRVRKFGTHIQHKDGLKDSDNPIHDRGRYHIGNQMYKSGYSKIRQNSKYWRFDRIAREFVDIQGSKSRIYRAACSCRTLGTLVDG